LLQDITAAARLLEPLCENGNGSPALLSAIARVYLQGGHLSAASRYFKLVDADPTADEPTKDMNKAIEACALGNWELAIGSLRKILEYDPDNPLVCFPSGLISFCRGADISG